jgi:hypothetical protein
MNAPHVFPLIALQPVHDVRHAWVALQVVDERPCDGATLQRLLEDRALAGVLDILPCIVPADPFTIDPALAKELPRDRLILSFPW